VNGREHWLVQLRENWRQSRGSQWAGRILDRELENGSELSLSLSRVKCWKGSWICGSDVGIGVARVVGRTNRFFVVHDGGRVIYKCLVLLHVYATKNSSHPTELGVIVELTIDKPPLDDSLVSLHPSLILFLCKFLRPSSFIPICISIRCRWCGTRPSHIPRPKLEPELLYACENPDHCSFGCYGAPGLNTATFVQRRNRWRKKFEICPS